MKTELKPRRNTNRGDEIIQNKLDPVLLKTVEYFAKKMRSRSLYDTGKYMLCMNTFRVEKAGLYYAHISYYHDFHRDAGRALRMMIYGMIMQDINDILVLDLDCKRRIFDLFDDPSILERLKSSRTNPTSYGTNKNTMFFKMYSGWKKQWIMSLLKTAIKYDDPGMFEKIMKKVIYNKYKDMFQELLNDDIPIEYKCLILRYVPDDGTELML